MRCMAFVTLAAYSGDCTQQIRLNVLDFALFTDSFARHLKVQRSNKCGKSLMDELLEQASQ